MRPDLEAIPAPTPAECAVFSEIICGIILRDSFTVLIMVWAALQTTWVTMLLFVQTIQISRAVTTWEAMKGRHGDTHGHGHGHGHGPSGRGPAAAAGEVVTAAVTAGATSLDSAQLSHGGAGRHKKPEGWFAQWKKLLGVDTFVATAQSTSSGSGRNRGNPYSRGVVTNCRDFWCDPAPIFSARATGAGMLDGEVINYARMYETPPRMKARRGPGDGTRYQEVDGEEMV